MTSGSERSRDLAAERPPMNPDKPRAFSLDLDKGGLPQTGPPGSSDSGRRRTGTSRGGLPHHAPTKVMIIWLESFEDNVYVPLGKSPIIIMLILIGFIRAGRLTVWLVSGDLLAYTSTGLEIPSIPSDPSHSAEKDCFVIFLHALPSGLLRVKLQGPQGRYVNVIMLLFVFNLKWYCKSNSCFQYESGYSTCGWNGR